MNGAPHDTIEAKEIGLCKLDLNLVYPILSLSLFATPPKACLERAETRRDKIPPSDWYNLH